MLRLSRPVLSQAAVLRRIFATFLSSIICISAVAEGGLPSGPSKLAVKLTTERVGSSIRFFVENLEPAAITATFNLGLVNLKANTSFPHTLGCPSHQKTEAFTLQPVNAGSDWTYTLTNYFTLGSRLAVHDDAYLYSLPYPAGKAFLVSQAFGGAFSHSGPEKYAIDWNMPEGTPIRAARGGQVVGLRQDSTVGGASRRFEDAANYILIQHDDQTIGNYAHLMPHGAKVRVGQRVEVGELIGYSGNTGFSSGPHLHFSVFKAADGRTRESVPIRFRLGTGAGVTLVAGETYRNESAPLLATKVGERGARD